MASDEQAIRTLMATWHSASAAGDVDAVLALMSDDVVFLMAGQPPMRGRDAFAAGMRGLLAQHRLVSNGTIEEIEVTGDWAYCWCYLTVEIQPIAGGNPVTRVGNTLSILHKRNGAWLLVRDANMLAPTPAGS